MVSVSTRDCPVRENFSQFLMIFSIPNICPSNMFFVLKPFGYGIAHQHIQNTGIRYDLLYPPPISNDIELDNRDLNTARSGNNNFHLTDEYKITLRIFWDDDFNIEFGNTAVERFSIFC